jgi:hypothetical protein
VVRKKRASDITQIIKDSEGLHKGNRKGRWTEAEKEYINKSLTHKSPEQIAAELRRPLEAVLDYKDKFWAISKKEIKDDLRATPEWAQLKEELFDYEINRFEFRYAEIMDQFSDEVLATEKTQIFQLIRIEILMGRNLKEKKRAIETIDILHKELMKLRRASTGSEEDKVRIMYLEDQIRSVDMSAGAKSSEYLNMQKQHESILKNLKGTRDQRIQNAESRKKKWLDIIQSLEEKEYKDNEGKYLALMKKATEKEMRRLSEIHDYGMGTVDKPILTADTVES